MKFGMILLVALFVIPLTTRAQNSVAATPMVSPPSAVSSRLQITASTKVPSVGSTLVGSAKCDDDGNIYARTEHPGDDNYDGTKAPVQKIKPDGSVVESYKVTDAGTDISAMDFFVSGDGKVYEDAWTQEGKFVHVLEFSGDGSLKTNIPLDPENSIYPYQIAVFRSGEFLVSGLHGLHLQTPITAVFDAKGKLIKNIYEPEDEESRQKAEAGDAAFISDSGYGNYYASHGDVALGSDGNAYLLRAVSPALIYVISPKGEAIRKMRIESRDPGWVARTIRPASGRLAVSFAQRGYLDGIIRVVDLEG